MPIYAYRCSECGFAEDILRKISDPVLTVCPSCGKPEFKKQVTAAGFQLKGTGWYATDFKGGAKKETAKESTKEVGKEPAKESAAASQQANGESGKSGSSGSSSQSASTASSTNTTSGAESAKTKSDSSPAH